MRKLVILLMMAIMIASSVQATEFLLDDIPVRNYVIFSTMTESLTSTDSNIQYVDAGYNRVMSAGITTRVYLPTDGSCEYLGQTTSYIIMGTVAPARLCFYAVAADKTYVGDVISFVYQISVGLDIYEYVDNTAPVINAIIPDERVELLYGESQLYLANVTDDEDDADYSWDLGGIEVSTSETYLANWDDIAPGIYTLTLTVDDGAFSDSASVTLEIRARGGAPTGENELVQEEQIVTDSQIQPEQQSKLKQIWQSILDWFQGLWRR